MEESVVRKGFIAKGTTCESCAEIIKKQALKIDGVQNIEFDYSSETGYVTFDSAKTNIDEILYKIEEKGYNCFILKDEEHIVPESKEQRKSYGWIFAVVGIIIAGFFLVNLTHGIELPQISQNRGYGLLFVVGLLTGFHCIAMCGGFVVSYTTKNAQAGKTNHTSHLLYGAGKTISYTIIGAIFGLIGSLIAFTPMMRGVAGLLAGLFLILFGLKMLNIFPILRKIQFRTPKFINKFLGKESQNSSPLVIGLLNGLMIACGPLQAIYIMAAGTGSMLEGAKLLFIFALGTLPVMLGFGYVTSLISNKIAHKILKASGVIVVILGLIMLNNGLVLTGTGYDAKTVITKLTSPPTVVKESSTNMPLLSGGYQEIRMNVTSDGWQPDTFVLKKGIPVKWIINGKEITNCNKAIQVPKLGLSFDIKQGEQVIEFTPKDAGVIPWSCWMGMIPGTFIVKDDISNSQEIQQEIQNLPVQKQGSCGGTGGGCGCGMMN
jgi:sulfite exporter TauE/SafE/copper chaperone CopZ